MYVPEIEQDNAKDYKCGYGEPGNCGTGIFIAVILAEFAGER